MNYYYTISLRVQKGGHQEVSEEAKTVMLAATVKSPKGTFRTFGGFLPCSADMMMLPYRVPRKSFVT